MLGDNDTYNIQSFAEIQPQMQFWHHTFKFIVVVNENSFACQCEIHNILPPCTEVLIGENVHLWSSRFLKSKWQRGL